MPLGAIRPRHIAEYIAERSGNYGASVVGRDVDLLHAIFKTAMKEELVESNPAAGAERPKLPRRKWRILEPPIAAFEHREKRLYGVQFHPEVVHTPHGQEILKNFLRATANAFDDRALPRLRHLPVEVSRVLKAFTDEQAKTVFLTLVLTGIRRSELQALRWGDVDLVENVIKIRNSKSEDGIRSIALSTTLAEELWQHRRRSSFQGEDERVFCHPERGTVYQAVTFENSLRAALEAAGIEGRVRAFHDLTHTAITNDAAAGANPIALMTKAGHADMKTTKTYMHMAGVVFRDEANRLEARLLGVESSTRLSESESIEHEPGRVAMRLDDPTD